MFDCTTGTHWEPLRNIYGLRSCLASECAGVPRSASILSVSGPGFGFRVCWLMFARICQEQTMSVATVKTMLVVDQTLALAAPQLCLSTRGAEGVCHASKTQYFW